MQAIEGGSVMRQVGVGIRSAIEDETVRKTIGVAYFLQGSDNYLEQYSMYYFRNLKMADCVGDDSGYMRLLRSGGIQCNQCEMSMNQYLTRDSVIEQFSKPYDSQIASVFSYEYI